MSNNKEIIETGLQSILDRVRTVPESIDAHIWLEALQLQRDHDQARLERTIAAARFIGLYTGKTDAP